MDVKKNTPLHYAAGCACDLAAAMHSGSRNSHIDTQTNTHARSYGRAEYVDLLLNAGASTGARNETGKTALDLVKVNAANPVNKEADIMARLGKGFFFQDV
jgi:ankyrin repeat protein